MIIYDHASQNTLPLSVYLSIVMKSQLLHYDTRTVQEVIVQTLQYY